MSGEMSVYVCNNFYEILKNSRSFFRFPHAKDLNLTRFPTASFYVKGFSLEFDITYRAYKAIL